MSYYSHGHWLQGWLQSKNSTSQEICAYFVYHVMSCHVASYRIVRIVSHRIILYHTYIISYRIVTYHMSYHILHHISYIILYCIHNFSRTEAAVVLIMPHVATCLLLSLMLNPIEAAVVPAPRPRHMVQRFYLSVFFFLFQPPFQLLLSRLPGSLRPLQRFYLSLLWRELETTIENSSKISTGRSRIDTGISFALNNIPTCTKISSICPWKYAHGFAVLCFVVVIWSIIGILVWLM